MTKLKGNPCDIVANVLDCEIAISGFEFWSRYNFHFRTNTLAKCTDLLIPVAMGRIVPLLFIYMDGFGIR